MKITHTLLFLATAAHAEPLFSPVPASHSNLETHHRWTTPKEWTALNSYAAMAGVAMGDYDGDGLLDLFLGSQTDGGALYKNLGNLTFKNVSSEAGLTLSGRWTTGATFADVNQDGHLDLFLGAYRQKNSLYLNQGNGTFREAATEAGLDFSGATVQASFADFDRDGDLDCYLLTNRIPATPNTEVNAQLIDGKVTLPPESREFKNVIYDHHGKYHIVDSGQHDYLFENDGTGKFRDVTHERGLHGHTAPGLSSVWWDSNNDHWPDLYVANDFYLPDHHWLNEKGKKFADTHRKTFPHQPWFSMGSDFSDLNGDGFFDYLTTDMSPSSHFRSKLTMGDMSADTWFLDSADPPQYMRNAVYLNGGNGRFMEVAQALGLSSTNWTWAVRASDLDLDGLEDLIFTTGMTRDFENSDLNAKLKEAIAPYNRKTQYEAYSKAAYDFWKDLPQQKEHNFAFRNKGNLQFKEVTEKWGLSGLTVSNGLAIGDLDNDGDPEVIITNFDAPPSFYRNNSRDPGIKIRFNGQAIGARLILTLKDKTEQHRLISNTRGYLSSGPQEEIFTYSPGSALRVIWPSGKQETLQGLEPGETVTLKEANAKNSDLPISHPPTPLFTESPLLTQLNHTENTAYNEFTEEPLLPHRVSQLGPGLAFGDLNQDQYDDLIISGAADGHTMIGYLTPKGPASNTASQRALSSTLKSEHLTPLLFDADQDGDLDVLLTSGGTEHKNETPALGDHLFLNNGKGVLSLAPGNTLPPLNFSAGSATTADIDQDGDLDLFIAGRVSPGAYPTSPRSALLRNDSKPGQPKFTDITKDAAPFLMKPGMVTSALFSDATGDHRPDLLLTVEWGSVLLLENLGDHRFASPKELTPPGWFTSISPGDIDHDGDIDYLVGNFGHNTKYHPTKKSPTRIYYGDFDGSGKPQIVEAAIKKGCLLPVRGKSCSQNAMPFIRKKFPTYQSFAVQELTDIYPDQELKKSLTLEAHDLSTVVLINEGKNTFSVKKLPLLAQLSPTFGSTITDLNGDGHLDLALAQNFFGPQRETGRYNGSQGFILLGDGKGDFHPMWPNDSGFSIPGDATALCVADLNYDQKPDLAVANNNGRVQCFNNNSENNFRALILRAPPGNPTAIGAKISVTVSNRPPLFFEISSGGSYLSQSSSSIFLPVPNGSKIQNIKVLWPNGKSSTHQPVEDQKRIILTQPTS